MAAGEGADEPSVKITLTEIYNQVQTLRKWMWAMPPTLIASVASLLVALSNKGG